MVKLRRANEVRRVEDIDVDYYVNLGYDVIDEDGNVLREAIPNSIGVLQTKFLEHTARIAELEAEIKKLKSKRTKSAE